MCGQCFGLLPKSVKKREVDPTIVVLRDSMSELNELPADEAEYERRQIENLLEFFETGMLVYSQLEAENPNSILKLLGKAIRFKKSVSS